MKSREEVSARAIWLRAVHDDRAFDKRRIRDLMDGGAAAVQALLGDVQNAGIDLPTANLVLSGLTRLGQKLGRLPDLRVDPPATNDTERARKAAEKRERIGESLDAACKLRLQLPQVGRWLPGYGFTSWVIRERMSPDGFRYPHAELRDSYDGYPAPWGVDQQPLDIAYWRVVPVETLVAMYPEKRDQIAPRQRQSGGVVLDPALGRSGLGAWRSEGGWENASRQGIEVAEYYDQDGMWLVIPSREVVLEHVPNILESGPQFVVAKKFSFNKLTGQYDHVIGLMADLARLNLLARIGIEDATFAETNVFGEPPDGEYRRGRFAINVMPPGTTVQKMQHNLPYQYFEQINRVERQLRITAGYPVTDDAQSPANMAATGAGLEELMSSITGEVREYQLVLSDAVEMLDSKRFEWDEKAYGGRRKPLNGVRKGVPFAETYDPATHIKGNYRTRRVFGMFSSWDEPQQIVGGLQLMQGRVISTQTMQENVDGIEDVVREQERIRDERAAEALFEAVIGLAQQQDPRALMAAVEMQPEGEFKETMRRLFTPEEPQLSPEEEAFLAPPQTQGPAPDLATVMSQMASSGAASGGVRTIGALPGRVSG